MEQSHATVYGLLAVIAIMGVIVSVLWIRFRTASHAAVTERERLRSSVMLLLDSITVGIVATDATERCTVVNRTAAESLGRSAKELVGAPIGAVLVTGGSPDEFYAKSARPGERLMMHDAAFRRPDGTAVPVEYSVAPIIDRGRPAGVVVTFTDTTLRRRLEAQLEQAHRVESLGRLAAAVAHEFNNVLMGIQPFAEVIARDVSVETRLKAVKHILNSVQRGKDVAGDILRFTRSVDPVRSAVDVEALLESFAAEARRLIGRAFGIRVEVEGRLFADGDSNQLHQALMNLALNARDAMRGEGQIAVSARRERNGAHFPFGVVEKPERYIHISFADEGIGIPPETINHIFEPLFTTKRTGTGLGLSIVHQIVKRHGGEIFVESVVGEGTTFHLFLPAAEGTEETVAAVEDEAKTPPRFEVLLVEDDVNAAEGISHLLKTENMSVHVVASGAEALDVVARKPIDVVVLDIGLPDIDGRTVYNQILARHPAMPVIFSTGHADRSRFEDVLERPATLMLLKPYSLNTLLAAIAEVTTPS